MPVTEGVPILSLAWDVPCTAAAIGAPGPCRPALSPGKATAAPVVSNISPQFSDLHCGSVITQGQFLPHCLRTPLRTWSSPGGWHGSSRTAWTVGGGSLGQFFWLLLSRAVHDCSYPGPGSPRQGLGGLARIGTGPLHTARDAEPYLPRHWSHGVVGKGVLCHGHRGAGWASEYQEQARVEHRHPRASTAAHWKPQAGHVVLTWCVPQGITG